MTAGLVTNVNPMRSAGVVKGSSAGSGGNDFLEIFKANAGKTSQSQVDEQKIAEKKNSVNDSVNKISGDSKSSAKAEMTKKKAKVQNENATEEVNDAAEAAINEAARVLDVSAEEVKKAMEELGLEITDIFDESNIPQIVVEITGAEDAMAIMTDEALFDEVKEITQAVEDVSSELADKLGVSTDELADSIDVAAMQNAVKTADGKSSDKGETSAENGNENGASMNLAQTIVDNIKEAAQASETHETGFVTEMDDIYSQVSESLKLNMTEDVTEMEINLHPASLGNVKIQVAARDGMITANFVAQNEQVKAALETQIIELKDNMNEQGIKVESIEITLASHAFEENLSKEGDNSEYESETKKKRRQINLNEIEEDDDIVIEDEIRIAREMMMHNGTTVDYMA